jgi:hypothetical protein
VADRLLCFRLSEEESGRYLREGLCQKLNFILKECSVSGELKASLVLLREKVKVLVMQAFALGQL